MYVRALYNVYHRLSSGLSVSGSRRIVKHLIFTGCENNQNASSTLTLPGDNPKLIVNENKHTNIPINAKIKIRNKVKALKSNI